MEGYPVRNLESEDTSSNKNYWEKEKQPSLHKFACRQRQLLLDFTVLAGADSIEFLKGI